MIQAKKRVEPKVEMGIIFCSYSLTMVNGYA